MIVLHYYAERPMGNNSIMVYDGVLEVWGNIAGDENYTKIKESIVNLAGEGSIDGLVIKSLTKIN